MDQIYKFTSTPKKLIKNYQEAKILGEEVNIRPNKSHAVQNSHADPNPLSQLYSHLWQEATQAQLHSSFVRALFFTLTNNYIMPGQAGPIECP